MKRPTAQSKSSFVSRWLERGVLVERLRIVLREHL
jgi:hypothetical protein